MSKQKHIPVLLEAVLACLKPKIGDSYLDLTAGYGGHAAAVLERTKNPAGSVLVDRDQQAADWLRERFSSSEIVKSDFRSCLEDFYREGRQFDLILADLGVSSPHFEDVNRGFSLQVSAPLDMRMDQSQTLTADDIVNRYSEKELITILREYGEEPKAREIAGRIIRSRPIKTTDQLTTIVASAWPGRNRIHPATRTFQAIRIAVNDELKQLEASLPLMLKILAPGGRLVLISFHSLEDRLVKDFFAEHSVGYDAELKLITNKPLLANNEETVSNPRARSAKLRAAVKIKSKTERE